MSRSWVRERPPPTPRAERLLFLNMRANRTFEVTEVKEDGYYWRFEHVPDAFAHWAYWQQSDHPILDSRPLNKLAEMVAAHQYTILKLAKVEP